MAEITDVPDGIRKYDSNSEFRFLVIGSPSKWKQGTIEGDVVLFDNLDKLSTGGISLRKSRQFYRLEEYKIPIPNPVDLASDTSCEVFFILDKDTKQLLVYDLNTGYLEWIRCIYFVDPRAIAVGPNDLYILDGNSIFVLAKSNFQIERIVENVGVDPRVIALDTHLHRLYVYDTDPNQKQLYQVSYLTGKVSSLFNHGEGSQIAEVSSISVGIADNRLYLLDSGNRQVKIFSIKDPIEAEIVPLDKPAQAVFSGIAAINNENIFVGDKAKGIEYYYAHPRKYHDRPHSNDNTLPLFESLDYSRPTHKMILLKYKPNLLYAINFTDNWIIKFTLNDRFAKDGTYITPEIDSGIDAIQWHKYVLECEIPDPDNNNIEISYFASDSRDMPAEGQWIRTVLPNPLDALMFDAIGRYLRFKIRLFTNDERFAPSIWRIRAYLPRKSYLRYLPAIYQEDAKSKELLERFLSLFETFYNQIDELSFTKYIDVKSVPSDFLPWLASWLALANDENWPRENFRQLLGKAPHLYKMRGTRKGIEEIIKVFLDLSSSNVKHKKIECPKDSIAENEFAAEEERQRSLLATNFEYKVIIYESFQINKNCIIDDYKRLFCTDPYSFCVLLNPKYVDEKQFRVIKKIVQDEKPAHTVGHVMMLQPWFYLGMHTYLGVNTILQEPQFIVGKAAIGRDTQLSSSNTKGQINIQARIGIDTTLY